MRYLPYNIRINPDESRELITLDGKIRATIPPKLITEVIAKGANTSKHKLFFYDIIGVIGNSKSITHLMIEFGENKVRKMKLSHPIRRDTYNEDWIIDNCQLMSVALMKTTKLYKGSRFSAIKHINLTIVDLEDTNLKLYSLNKWQGQCSCTTDTPIDKLCKECSEALKHPSKYDVKMYSPEETTEYLKASANYQTTKSREQLDEAYANGGSYAKDIQVI